MKATAKTNKKIVKKFLKLLKKLNKDDVIKMLEVFHKPL